MKNLNKAKILEALISELDKELSAATHAAKVAHEDATNEESKPENQYDTRTLEASYVARGQAQRVADIKEILFDLKNIQLKNFTKDDGIAATALIEVESAGKNNLLLFMPKGGGFSVTIEGQRIQIVTPSTPLGEALFQMKKGESVLVELGNTEKEYDIIDVI